MKMPKILQPKPAEEESPLAKLEPLRKELIKSRAAADAISGNTYLATVGADMKLNVQGRGPCHGAWQARDHYIKKPFYALSTVQGSRRSPEIEKDFYTFLANESVFKDCFLSKDYEDILNYGWVFNTDQPNNVVGLAAIATRFYTECYSGSLRHRHPIYLKLRENGYSVWDSYFFAHVFSPESSAAFPVSINLCNFGHTIFTMQDRETSTVRNMMNARFVPERISSQSFKDRGGYDYGTLDNLWAEKKGSGKTAQHVFGMLRPREVVKKVDLHIFRKQPKTGYAIKDFEGMADVIAQFREIANA